MEVIAAIDLKGGAVVRMERGDLSTATVYDRDPVARAKAFVAAGARRLHVIDLDGALGSGENLLAIERICEEVRVPVQTGGGIRSPETAQARIDVGATEVIIGTLLVEDERIARNIIWKLGRQVIAGIDVRGDRVATHGWSEGTPVARDALAQRVAQWGVQRVIFTEILRDGMGLGYDIDSLQALAQAAPSLKITASGGARSLDDLIELRQKVPESVDSCIVGSALYKGTIDLAKAIEALA
jgi:phosphoribosylformimino-5-aminoimidazole carboxamide ribotide isomerase